MTFAAMSQRAQVARLRPLAHAALRAYGLEVGALRLLHHGFNTTFRVETVQGPRYALRLNVNSRRTEQQIGAEMAWLTALAQDTALRVPAPQRTLDGALMTHVPSPELGRELPAALFSWLPGRDLGERATPAQMREVGRAAATLHAHARSWTPPEGTGLKGLDHPLMDSPDNFAADREGLTPERREVIQAALQRVADVLRDLYARDTPHALHADLHRWNLRWARGHLAVFDFDDSGIGLPVQDLAIAAYDLRPRGELEGALLEGYAAQATPPAYTDAQYETLLAGRNLVLLNDLLDNTTADLRALLPRYLPNSVTKLRHFLDTGVFRHDVAGLITA